MDDRDPEPEPEANLSSRTTTTTNSSNREADVVNSFVWNRDGCLVLIGFFSGRVSCLQYIGIPYRAIGYQISVEVGVRTRDVVGFGERTATQESERNYESVKQ